MSADLVKDIDENKLPVYLIRKGYYKIWSYKSTYWRGTLGSVVMKTLVYHHCTERSSIISRLETHFLYVTNVRRAKPSRVFSGYSGFFTPSP